MEENQSRSFPYEFSPEDSRIIADLADKMRFVGLLVTILGALALLYSLSRLADEAITGGLIIALLTALFLAAIGIWSMRAGREFLLVDQTDGADVSHLMKALENLRRLYGLQSTIGWAVLVLLVLAIIFGVFADQAH